MAVFFRAYEKKVVHFLRASISRRSLDDDDVCMRIHVCVCVCMYGVKSMQLGDDNLI